VGGDLIERFLESRKLFKFIADNVFGYLLSLAKGEWNDRKLDQPGTDSHSPIPKWHLFLSYRSVSLSWVLALYDILNHLKYRVFFDQYVLTAGAVGRLSWRGVGCKPERDPCKVWQVRPGQRIPGSGRARQRALARVSGPRPSQEMNPSRKLRASCSRLPCSSRQVGSFRR
jgi:hypothetical protein